MKLGIIGTGRIAERFISTALDGLDAEVTCIYNPHIDSARRFADRHGVDIYTSDMMELTEAVQAVYIASPHETHYEYAKFLLENKIHVLCEKPMTLKKSETEELFDLAQRNNLVLMEAVKTAYCPGFNELLDIVRSGRIGRIVDVEAAFTRLTPINTREYETPVYNGSMLEFGSYGLLPVMKIMGTDYTDVEFKSVRAVNGTDIYTKAILTYPEGMASVKNGLGVKSEGQLLISGTKGYVLAPSPWWMTKKFEVRYEDCNRIETYTYPYDNSGLKYELGIFLYEIMAKSESIQSSGVGLSSQESVAMSDVMERFLSWNTPLWEQKNEELNKNLKNIPMPQIWAHRGCSMKCPENTLKSFKMAAELDGITGVELDVQFTQDKEIVVFHDENVKRVTDGDKNVGDYTFEEIKKLKVCGEEQIPTLREVLELLKPYCKSKGLLINIELKTSIIRYDGIEERTHKLVRQMGMEKYIVYSSFLAESVAMMKEIAPECTTGMLASDINDCISDAVKTKADALHPYVGGLTASVPDYMRNMPVRAWNCEEPFYNDGRKLKDTELDRFKAYGVTDIFTNVPEIYLEKIKE